MSFLGLCGVLSTRTCTYVWRYHCFQSVLLRKTTSWDLDCRNRSLGREKKIFLPSQRIVFIWYCFHPCYLRLSTTRDNKDLSLRLTIESTSLIHIFSSSVSVLLADDKRIVFIINQGHILSNIQWYLHTKNKFVPTMNKSHLNLINIYPIRRNCF